MRDFRHGTWQPTGLEHRLAELLAQSAAGTGSLTAVSVRTAIWEGSMAAIHENGGRFITLLAGLLPQIEKPDAAALHTAGLALDLVETITQTAPHRQAAPHRPPAPVRARQAALRTKGHRPGHRNLARAADPCAWTRHAITPVC